MLHVVVVKKHKVDVAAVALLQDMMPEAPQPPPPTKYVVPDIDKTVAEDPEEVCRQMTK